MKKLLIILFVGVVAVGCGSNGSKTDIISNDSGLDSLNQVNNTITHERDSISRHLYLEMNYWFDNNSDENNFTKIGIENPQNFLWDALNKKVELIPLKAILGGTMQLGKLEILSSKWLIVEYTDGHIMGKALYEYKIEEDSSVVFKLIDATENE